MNEQELQELSRRAAGCLPLPPWSFENLQLTRHDYERTTHTGKHWHYAGQVKAYMRDEVWLHESTEACAEIMVRVLWKWGCMVNGDDNTVEGGSPDHAAWVWGDHFPNMEIATEYACSDPMLAFRVAILRALVTLKEKS